MKNIIIKHSLLGIFCALLMNSCAHLTHKVSTSPASLPAESEKTPNEDAAIENSTSISNPSNSSDNTSIVDAVKIPEHQELLKKHFPTAESFEEVAFLPSKNGGSSFTGLVTRLLGAGLNRPYEGLRVRRYFYLALQNKKPVGVAHGSSDDVRGNTIHVFAVYTAGGTVKEVRVTGLPSNVEQEFAKGSYLKQFEGRSTEDFEVTLGKRGRIKSRGAMFKSVRYPPSSEARAYFEKVFRSMRFNTAFMDVAFFITQHPDLADKTSANGETEEVTETGISPLSPESFVKDKVQQSPIDGR